MTDFARRVQEELEYRGLTKTDLCKALELPGSTARSWWLKDAIPAADTALKVAKYLNVPLEYLLTGENPRPQVIQPVVCDAYESRMQKLFPRLDQRDKSTVLALVEALASKYASAPSESGLG